MPKSNQAKPTAEQKPVTTTGVVTPANSFSMTDRLLRFISDKRIQLLLIVVITFAFYGNSISNDFATDDVQFYTGNQFVQKGVAGIFDIFTKDYNYGYYAHTTFASGGRWRPLTPITFAIEKEYLNADPHISHFINLLLLAITGVIMLLFLRQYIFKASPVAAFMAVLLFIIHPVHTEAVSHIKSRDELLSWVFLLLTLYFSLNFLTRRNYWQLALSLVFYFLALLSKENGVTFIVILPLTFYFFTTKKLRSIVLATVPFAAVFACYILMRFHFVPFMTEASSDILSAAYLYATPVQHIATALMLLGKYILLLFYPNPLSCDYSYNQIPYVNFSDWRVWLSVTAQATLVVYALLKLKEKNVVAYGILFYFCSIFMASNIIIDIGPIFGERFLYQPSFGFCIAIVAAIDILLQKIKFKSAAQKFSILSLLTAIVILLCGFQTIRRNAEWENDKVLFTADVKKAPNCMELHGILGKIFENDGLNAQTLQERNDNFNRALGEFDTAIILFPKYAETWSSIGLLYTLMGDTDKAINAYLECTASDSTFSQGYIGLGSIYYYKQNYRQALTIFKKGSELDTMNAQFYFDIGICYHDLDDYAKAIEYYTKTLKLIANPQDQGKHQINPQQVEQLLLDAESQLQNQK